ncbi:hypothetical protein LguiB_030011 [Lonicera macranthoides]
MNKSAFASRHPQESLPTKPNRESSFSFHHQPHEPYHEPYASTTTHIRGGHISNHPHKRWTYHQPPTKGGQTTLLSSNTTSMGFEPVTSLI